MRRAPAFVWSRCSCAPLWWRLLLRRFYCRSKLFFIGNLFFVASCHGQQSCSRTHTLRGCRETTSCRVCESDCESCARDRSSNVGYLFNQCIIRSHRVCMCAMLAHCEPTRTDRAAFQCRIHALQMRHRFDSKESGSSGAAQIDRRLQILPMLLPLLLVTG